MKGVASDICCESDYNKAVRLHRFRCQDILPSLCDEEDEIPVDNVEFLSLSESEE